MYLYMRYEQAVQIMGSYLTVLDQHNLYWEEMLSQGIVLFRIFRVYSILEITPQDSYNTVFYPGY
jgi:hypothetical protein